MNYADFLASKAPVAQRRGFKPQPLPSHLFEFQKQCVSHLIECGSGGLFLDTGLGKTLCQLEWLRQCADASNGRGLLLTPLAVAGQIKREADNFGYQARIVRSADDVGEGINICNYDRLHLLDADAFGAVSLDESSILKSLDGKTSSGLIERFSGHRFRLSASATPAPNDHRELGRHSEFCGVMAASTMLARWFINDAGKASQEWRLKGHAVNDFWQWMASWCRMAQMPSDLGFSDEFFVLPPLRIVKAQAKEGPPVILDGLFGGASVSATDMHKVKRQTSLERAKLAASIAIDDSTEPYVIWCDTDYEADALIEQFRGRSDFVEVRGSHTAERKESAIAAFVDGTARVLITKPSVCGAGLNLQHCANTVFVGRSFSYESWYQAVRRFWRFGQKRPVTCTVIVAEGEDAIGAVIDRKAGMHADMKAAMAKAMREAVRTEHQSKTIYNPQHKGSFPQWLQ